MSRFIPDQRFKEGSSQAPKRSMVVVAWSPDFGGILLPQALCCPQRAVCVP